MASANKPTVVEVDDNGRRWAKSSTSDVNGGNCIEVATDRELIRIRSSLNRRNAIVTVPVSAWSPFIDLATRLTPQNPASIS
ncbi:DUF397 domain-containing protein [Actinokineospora terrae]|uniref:DUF397 domain-containing protein n=1 Tax=Actinokineospora terrae TaxID=155974 RepID=UPI000B856951